MNIGYLCNEYPPAPHGGIGTFVQTMARAMQQAGHRVSVVGLGAAAQSWNDQGVRVLTLSRTNIPGAGGALDRFRLYRSLQAEARAGRVELIEIPEYEGLLPFPFVDCPVAVRLHLSATAISLAQGNRPSRLRRRWELETLKHHPNWIAVSAYALELTRGAFGIAPRQSSVIHCPVTNPLPSESPDLPFDFVLYAGKVSARKGAYVLAQAATLFLRAHPELQVVYVGPAAEEDGRRADSRIRDIVGPELARRVHFLGRLDRPAVVRCMTRALMLAFPSTLETFGLVIAETMLAGTPVIIADTGPARELVSHEETGILVPPDDPVALAQAVGRLAREPHLRSSLGAAGERCVKARFQVGACVSATLEFYRRVIANPNGVQIS